MAVGTAALCLTFLLVGVFVFLSAETKLITAVPGQDVTLICRAPNNNIGHVKWSRTDLGDEYVLLYQDGHFDPLNQHPSFKNRVDLRDRQMNDRDVSLILKDVKINDTGTYECGVFMNEWNHSFIILSVVTPDPKPFRAESGQKITLPCQAPKNNITHVEWNRADLMPQYLLLYQDGQLNLSNQHPSFKNRVDLQDNWKKDGNVSLILKDVTVNDDGTYVCCVLMEETRSRKNRTIRSLMSLRVFPKPKNMTAKSGQDVTLPCRAPKNNITHVEWNRADLMPQYLLLYQDGQLNLSNQHPSFKNRVDLQDNWKKDGNVSLILKDVKMNDSGTYECNMFMRETKTQNKDLINIINLSVSPGQTGGPVWIICVSAVLLVFVVAAVVVVVVFICKNKCKCNRSTQTHVQHPEDTDQRLPMNSRTVSDDMETEVNHPENPEDVRLQTSRL